MPSPSPPHCPLPPGPEGHICEMLFIDYSPAFNSMVPFMLRLNMDSRILCSFYRFRGRLEKLSPSGPCSLPPLSIAAVRRVVDARSLVPVVAATSEPGGGHWK
ncbi:hypothetical protein L3Q82_012946 [Scortum barcoo]|uniref:Uncharacterized protein n=1 Tax=Scortum barcoo TaxID=214431 RepID=A0ACB8W0T9_9TELE|nr:hypothetical protein L3Q82_012946 [Scortum barcoo]